VAKGYEMRSSRWRDSYTECGEDDDGCASQYEANYDQNNNNDYEK
jgi:hypothetical protein